MREVPTALDAAWILGDFTNLAAPMARITVQHLDVELHKTAKNVYASFLFGKGSIPKELPNVKSSKWSRSIDQDIATATFEFYNTAPQPLGTTFDPDMGVDQPGYYTFNRGGTQFSSRWGHQPNDWSGVLMPDNVLRSYEGYGFDVNAIPELDANLVQTGVWIIDSVTYEANGLITAQCSDLARILRDQIIFVPVVPKKFYPLAFSPVPKKSGFKAAYNYTYTETDSGKYDKDHPPPKNWDGPLTAPGSFTALGQNSSIDITWAHVPDPPTGYKVTGYQAVVDGVRLQDVNYKPTATVGTIKGHGIVNGNVYSVQLVAIYERLSDGHQVASNPTAVHWAYTHNLTVTAQIQPNSIQPNTTSTGVENGWVKYHVQAGPIAKAIIIVYTQGGDKQVAYEQDVTTTGDQYFDTGTGDDLTTSSILVYPKDGAGHIGQGDCYFGDSTFAFPPNSGKAPQAPQQTSSSKVTGKDGKTQPLKPVAVKTTYNNCSNPPHYHTVVSGDTLWDLAQHYYGDGSLYHVIYEPNKDLIDKKALEHGFTTDYPHWIFPGEKLIIPGEFGHLPQDAFDGKDSTYWLSGSNERNDQATSYEWLEASVPNVQLCQVKFTTVKDHYLAYVSVYANGSWVHTSPKDQIPYKPNDGVEGHKNANIPFLESVATGSKNDITVTLSTPVPGATRVRLTFYNLDKFDVDNDYHVGVREFVCYADANAKGNGSSPPAKPGPVKGSTDTDVSEYSVFVPAKEVAGAGAHPGTMEDFTDIVKLLCAWGGFYWPQDATQVLSDGTEVSYDFGPGPYGLINVDPVLGGQKSGRVWGDFEDAGTAGVASQPVSVWDKKSLLDGIVYVRDILGMNFFVDEGGGIVWRIPNLFGRGNYTGNLAADAGRTSDIVTIDEAQTLISLRATLDSKNVRERYWVASTDGQVGALAAGYNPNPTGLRRVAGWTDQHFASNADAQLMADLLAIRALMTYRIDSITIPGYPRIQIDDQVRIFERVASEGYLHYVRGISSNLDMESGVYTYDLDVNWLGEQPFDLWIFDPKELSQELQTYLDAMTFGLDTTPTAGGPGPTSNPGSSTGSTSTGTEDDVKLIKVAGNSNVYITNGVTKRHVQNTDELNDLVDAGIVGKTVHVLNLATFNAIVTVT